MTDITERYFCPLSGDVPAPPPCPSCGGTGRVMRDIPCITPGMVYAASEPCGKCEGEVRR